MHRYKKGKEHNYQEILMSSMKEFESEILKGTGGEGQDNEEDEDEEEEDKPTDEDSDEEE